MLEFGRIEYLYFLATVPALVLLFVWAEFSRTKKIGKIGDRALVSQLLRGTAFRWRILTMVCLALSFIFLSVGTANPRAGTKTETVKRQGVDICIAFDVSKSMLAEDLKPSRMERAKQWTARFINKLQGDRVGLVVYAAKAFLQMPITADYSAASVFVKTLSNEMIGTAQGTSLAEAVSLARRAFDSASSAAKSKALIIITDGEDHEEGFESALKEAVDAGITLYTVGVGDTKGVPIPLYNTNGVQTDFKRAKDNTIVLTQLNEPFLQEIARSGGGVYVRLSAGEEALESLLSSISSLEKTEFEERVYTEFDDYFPYLLSIGLFLLVVEAVLPRRTRKAPPQ